MIDPVTGRGSISGRISLKNLSIIIVVLGIRLIQKNIIKVLINEFSAKSLKSSSEEGSSQYFLENNCATSVLYLGFFLIEKQNISVNNRVGK